MRGSRGRASPRPPDDGGGGTGAAVSALTKLLRREIKAWLGCGDGAAGPERDMAVNGGTMRLVTHMSERIRGRLLDDVIAAEDAETEAAEADDDYTYLLFHPREVLLDLLPGNAVVAEIGVAKGAFSRQILARARPAGLHLIDPWEEQADDAYRPDPANVEQGAQDKRVERIRGMFAGEIEAGTVVVHRDYSGAALARFDPGTFDWVYVDAMHTYDAVLADLRACRRVVRPGGLILGHDYANHGLARGMNFGVVEAVRDFAAESGWRLLCLTADEYPTYVLAEGRGDAVEALEAEILARLTVLKVHGFLRMRYRQEYHIDRGRRRLNMYVSLK